MPWKWAPCTVRYHSRRSRCSLDPCGQRYAAGTGLFLDAAWEAVRDAVDTGRITDVSHRHEAASRVLRAKAKARATQIEAGGPRSACARNFGRPEFERRTALDIADRGVTLLPR